MRKQKKVGPPQDLYYTGRKNWVRIALLADRQVEI